MNLTIVGLTTVNISLGLALKALDADIAIVGHDPDPQLAKRAHTLGAIDSSHWNLISACENADLILIDQPMSQVQITLEATKDELKEGTVIIDLTPIKEPVIALAHRILPAHVQFVGGHLVSPNLSQDADPPSADLVKDATFYIVPINTTSQKALDAATNLAQAIGAVPQYIDAKEHDGLVASTSGLPLASAIAMMAVVGKGGGWNDRIGCVGPEWSQVASALTNMSPGAEEALLANSRNLLPWLDALCEELSALRQLLAEEDSAQVSILFQQAVKTYEDGLAHEESKPLPVEDDNYSPWRNMFLGNLGRKRRRPNRQED